MTPLQYEISTSNHTRGNTDEGNIDKEYRNNFKFYDERYVSETPSRQME